MATSTEMYAEQVEKMASELENLNGWAGDRHQYDPMMEGSFEVYWFTQYFEDYPFVAAHLTTTGTVIFGQNVVSMEDAAEDFFMGQGNNQHGNKYFNRTPSATAGDIVMVRNLTNNKFQWFYVASVGFIEITFEQVLEWVKAGPKNEYSLSERCTFGAFGRALESVSN